MTILLFNNPTIKKFLPRDATTNPSLMAKEGIKGKTNVAKHYVDICSIVDGDVSAEVI